MLRIPPTHLSVFLFLPLLALPLLAQSTALQYQKRAHHHEGLRPTEVTGGDIVLLSARLDAESSPRWPDTMHLRFYLPGNDDVHITVRQLQTSDEYYWLDQITQPWSPNTVNTYRWSSDTVLRKLTALQSSDLGALARLGTDHPAKKETIAPVLLAARAPDQPVYRFTFKTNGDAKIRAAIYSENDTKLKWNRAEEREDATIPFTLRWRSEKTHPEGWYRLVLSGYFTANNDKINQEVRFYHHLWPTDPADESP